MTLRRTARRIEDLPTSASMSDVGMMLIFFFLVTSVFSASKGLVTEQGDPIERLDSVEPMIVRIASEGLRVDDVSVPVGSLRQHLRGTDPTRPVILVTDDHAPYASMVRVYDELLLRQESVGLVQGVFVPTGSQVQQFALDQ